MTAGPSTVGGFAATAAFTAELVGAPTADGPTYGFDRDGSLMPVFRSRWGAPLVAHVVPRHASTWTGQFAAGGPSGIDALFASPSPSQLCAVAAGHAYLIDVQQPERGAIAVIDGAQQIVALDDPQLLLLVRQTDMFAIGASGVAWHTARLANDDLHVIAAARGRIECRRDGFRSPPTFVLDAATGARCA